MTFWAKRIGLTILFVCTLVLGGKIWSKFWYDTSVNWKLITDRTLERSFNGKKKKWKTRWKMSTGYQSNNILPSLWSLLVRIFVHYWPVQLKYTIFYRFGFKYVNLIENKIYYYTKSWVPYLPCFTDNEYLSILPWIPCCIFCSWLII